MEWLAGFIFGLLIHESGHVVMAELNGDEIRHTSGANWECVEECNIKSIAAGGFLAQAISSEVLLRTEKSKFKNGWLAWNIVNPVKYTISNEIKHNTHGDLANYTNKEANLIEAVTVIHSLSVAKRTGWDVLPQRNGVIFSLNF